MAPRTEQDRRLLASKLFSDVVVNCRTRSWRLHRSILCSRSHYFRAALAGPFQEAETREIDLSEHDEETIDRLLTWIYTKQLPPTVSFHGGTCYETAVKLFVAADFCLVRELREDCLEALERSVWEQALRTQRQFDAAPDKTAFLKTGGDLDNLFRGVRAAYEADFGVLKDVFIDFMRDTHFWPATDRAFQEHLLARLPRFSHDVLLRIPELCRDGKYWPFEVPDACFICGESAFGEPTTYWARLGSFEGRIVGFCNTCQRNFRRRRRRLREESEDEDGSD
ncbi:hypothetical protein DL765_011648 [Monosporascus sp. GIB2]|nr:hypothetical protein DL765_011648 [Monosporascus sp. GIB2]